ncbi:hypothetical protein PV325_005453 [Microctonus aethiopoides]|nr:hypothetical protein PV325_005453 [Microctonus aethiopoides]
MVSVDRVVEENKSLTSISVLLIVWFNECYKQQSIVNIANSIVAIDIANIRLQRIYSLQPINKYIPLCFAFNLLIWITLITLDYILFPQSLGITSIPILIPSFMCSCFLLKFAFTLNQLERRFESINNALQKFSKNSAYECELTVSSVLINQIKTRDLLTIKRAHELFGKIIYSAYYFAQLIINPAKHWSLLIAFNSTIYLTMEFFPIIVMAVSVTRLTDQIETTPNMLYHIMDAHQNNQQMISQLKQFSLELLHRKIQITAYNFIPLDCTLLHSVYNQYGNNLFGHLTPNSIATLIAIIFENVS